MADSVQTSTIMVKRLRSKSETKKSGTIAFTMGFIETLEKAEGLTKSVRSFVHIRERIRSGGEFESGGS